MNKIFVIYWSQTGNTEAMAKAVGEGIIQRGKEAVVMEVGSADTDMLKDAQAFALGCPAMGAEVLEEDEMEPFVCELEGKVTGKNIGLFGSYGWGDGQWMREWEDRMKAAGAVIAGDEGIICNDAPDEDILNKCRELGKKLAEY